MSRSYKKHPICGWAAAESEKEDKVRAHKKFRRKAKVKVNKIDPAALIHGDFWENEPEVVLPEKMREVSEVYSFAKDGKQYVTGKNKEIVLRK